MRSEDPAASRAGIGGWLVGLKKAAQTSHLFFLGPELGGL